MADEAQETIDNTATAEAPSLEEAIADDIFTMSVDEEEDESKDAGDKKESTEKETPKKEEAKKDEGPSLEDRLKQLEQDKANLKKALHEERQSKKKAKTEPDEEVLDDATILKIMEQHEGDNATLLNVFKYIAKQQATGIKKDVFSEAEVMNRKKQADALLRERVPDFDVEGTEVNEQLGKIKEAIGLSDHPLGDFLAAGVAAFTQAPKIRDYWYEKGKQEALAEGGRKKDIQDGKLEKGSGKTGVGNSPPKATTANIKQMGLTDRQAKIYERLLGNKTKSVSMEG